MPHGPWMAMAAAIAGYKAEEEAALKDGRCMCICTCRAQATCKLKVYSGSAKPVCDECFTEWDTLWLMPSVSLKSERKSSMQSSSVSR